MEDGAVDIKSALASKQSQQISTSLADLLKEKAQHQSQISSKYSDPQQSLSAANWDYLNAKNLKTLDLEQIGKIF